MSLLIALLIVGIILVLLGLVSVSLHFLLWVGLIAIIVWVVLALVGRSRV